VVLATRLYTCVAITKS